MRDLTRGGLSSAMNEIAESARVGISLEERKIPVSEAVRGVCELFGLDPMYVANEGKLIAIVAPEDAEAALAAMRTVDTGVGAADDWDGDVETAGVRGDADELWHGPDCGYAGGRPVAADLLMARKAGEMTLADNHRMVRRRVKIAGVVQGVGFRPYVYGLATELEVSGEVGNGTGGVVVEIEGGGRGWRSFCVGCRWRFLRWRGLSRWWWRRLRLGGWDFGLLRAMRVGR
jgi:acylphosphatase